MAQTASEPTMSGTQHQEDDQINEPSLSSSNSSRSMESINSSQAQPDPSPSHETDDPDTDDEQPTGLRPPYTQVDPELKRRRDATAASTSGSSARSNPLRQIDLTQLLSQSHMSSPAPLPSASPVTVSSGQEEDRANQLATNEPRLSSLSSALLGHYLVDPMQSQSISACNDSLLSIEKTIAESLKESVASAEVLRKTVDTQWSDPSQRLQAISMFRELSLRNHEAREKAMDFVLARNSTHSVLSASSPPRQPPRSLSLPGDQVHPVAAAHSSLVDARDLFSPTSHSKYTVSITLNEGITSDLTVREHFVNMTKGKRISVVQHDNYTSKRSYTAVLKSKEMVSLAKQAFNSYSYGTGESAVDFWKIARFSQDTHSSYSLRTGRLPWSAISCFIKNNSIDFNLARDIIQEENCEWFRTKDDIESIEYWPAKRNSPEEPRQYCLKIHVSVRALYAFLEQPVHLTRIERGVGLYNVYEDLPMPQCFRCHWIGHRANDCEFGISCRLCALHHLSNDCLMVQPDDKGVIPPVDPTKTVCHRCLENNQIYLAAPPTTPPHEKVPFFPKWVVSNVNHPATHPTCQSVLQNKEWLRLFVKREVALKRSVDLHNAPRGPSAPHPPHLTNFLIAKYKDPTLSLFPPSSGGTAGQTAQPAQPDTQNQSEHQHFQQFPPWEYEGSLLANDPMVNHSTPAQLQQQLGELENHPQMDIQETPPATVP